MNIEKYIKDIEKLVVEGDDLLAMLGSNDDLLRFRGGYEIWYSESLALIRFVLPDRADDFQGYYDKKNEDCLKKSITYTPPRREEIRFDYGYVPAQQVDYARSLFENQLAILKSAQRRFNSSLFDLKFLVQADVFDNELDAAEELLKKGFARAAGAVAGVVLEGHLETVCENHSVKISKSKPTIADYNEALKNANIIEMPDWRRIQFLGDIRNLCDHKKKDDPKKEEIEDLIAGVKKIMKNIF